MPCFTFYSCLRMKNSNFNMLCQWMSFETSADSYQK